MKQATFSILFFSALFLFSCKSKLEKIDLNDIVSHRTYQDDALAKSKNFDDSLLILRSLIKDYRNLNGDNSNYYYYLARLYHQINYLNIFKLYDSTNKSLFIPNLYTNFIDSSYFYAEKSLFMDKQNIHSMRVLCRTFHIERQQYIKCQTNIPISFNRDSVKWNERLNFIFNNALSFTKNDTSNSQKSSREIVELALNNLDFAFFENYKFDKNDKNKISALILYGQLFNHISKFKDFVFINFDRKIIADQIMPEITLAKNEKEKLDRIEYYNTNKILRLFLNKDVYVEGPSGRRIHFSENGSVQFYINTCESAGLFGGGTEIENMYLNGKFEVIDTEKLRVKLDKEFSFICNNGYEESWGKEIILIFRIAYPGLSNEKSAVELFDGVFGYQTQSDGWRKWVRRQEYYY